MRAREVRSQRKVFQKKKYLLQALLMETGHEIGKNTNRMENQWNRERDSRGREK